MEDVDEVVVMFYMVLGNQVKRVNSHYRTSPMILKDGPRDQTRKYRGLGKRCVGVSSKKGFRVEDTVKNLHLVQQ